MVCVVSNVARLTLLLLTLALLAGAPTVTRGQSPGEPFARDPAKDFNFTPMQFHGLGGIWSDGTTIWVADNSLFDEILAYNFVTKERNSEMDFNTSTLHGAGNQNPRGIWSDGSTMWVADSIDKKIYAYNLETKQWDSTKDFSTLYLGDRGVPRGIWSDGSTMWVSEPIDDRLYAYNLGTKQRDSTKDFNIQHPDGNSISYGIWSDRVTMWVAASTSAIDQKIYAYNLATKQRDAAKDFNTLHAAGNDDATGIWSDGSTMWVMDDDDAKIYAYNMPRATTTASRATTRPSDGPEEPEPPPPSAVAAHCITATASADGDGGTGRINLGETIEDRWSGGCPSVTRGGRMAKYYTFSLPHTTSVDIALGSHLDDYLVLRRGDLGGTVVARDDDSGPKNDSLITAVLPAGGYTIEATTFYMDGVEAEFLLSSVAVERVLYNGPASGKATTGYSPTDSTLDIRLLPTLPLPTLQITITDEDGFGSGQPGAAEMLLHGRIESDVGSPGSVMLAVPNGVWVDHGEITVQTSSAAGGTTWKTHTAEDERAIVEVEPKESGGIFKFLQGLSKTISGLIVGANPLDTIAGWLRALSGGRTAVSGETATMLGLGKSPVSPIFSENHANCFSQVSVPWLVEEEEVTGMRISIPVILTDSQYISVGAEFIARESGENEQSLVQAHDLLATGQDLPACQRP